MLHNWLCRGTNRTCLNHNNYKTSNTQTLLCDCQNVMLMHQDNTDIYNCPTDKQMQRLMTFAHAACHALSCQPAQTNQEACGTCQLHNPHSLPQILHDHGRHQTQCQKPMIYFFRVISLTTNEKTKLLDNTFKKCGTQELGCKMRSRMPVSVR